MPASDVTLTGEFPRRVVIASMAGVIAAMLMAALDSTIVGTAMPKVIADLNGFEHYAAVATVYLLAATLLVPIVGKLSDLYGRKPFLLSGVVIFVAGSALCGASQTMSQLVVFRGIQGVGAGFVQAMSFVTIADLFPPARRGRITGVMGAIFGLASVIGPAVGGLLTDGPGWRWCFYVNVPVGAIAIAILTAEFPHVRQTRADKPHIDWLGSVALVLGMAPLLLVMSWGGREYAWRSPEILGLSVFGLLMLVAFVIIERRSPEPLMPPALFRNRVMWTSSAATAVMAFAMFGTTLFIPLFIQAVIGSSAARSGAVMTPMMASLIFGSIAGGQIMTRQRRYKNLAVAGMLITVVGMFLLARMDASTTYTTVAANMIVVGLGLGLTMPVFTLAVQNAVDVGQVGVATASVQFVRSLGGSVGAALFGAVLVNRYSPALNAAIPSDVAANAPRAVMGVLRNPQALMSPAAASALNTTSRETVTVLLTAVRQALATSLHEVFLFATVVAALGLVLTLMLVDLPLRTTNRPAAQVEPA